MNNSFLYEVVSSLSNPNWEELCFIEQATALHLTQAITAQLESPTIALET